MRQPLRSRAGMEVRPILPRGYICTLLQSVESLKSLGDENLLVVLTFYTHGSNNDET